MVLERWRLADWLQNSIWDSLGTIIGCLGTISGRVAAPGWPQLAGWLTRDPTGSKQYAKVRVTGCFLGPNRQSVIKPADIQTRDIKT